MKSFCQVDAEKIFSQMNRQMDGQDDCSTALSLKWAYNI